MHGLCRVVGSGVDCKLGGNTYLIEPLTFGDLGTIEYHLLANRSTPLERLLADKGLDAYPDLKTELLQEAFKDLQASKSQRVVDPKELSGWIDSTDGIMFTAWLCLRPRLATKEALKYIWSLVTPAEQEEFCRRRDMISGLDPMSKAEWTVPELGENYDGPCCLEDKCRKEAIRGSRFCLEHQRGAKRQEQFINWYKWARELMADYPGMGFEQLKALTYDQCRLLRADKRVIGSVPLPGQAAAMRMLGTKNGDSQSVSSAAE